MKRYKPYFSTRDSEAIMMETADGDYVLWSEAGQVAALYTEKCAELGEAKARIAQLAEGFSEVCQMGIRDAIRAGRAIKAIEWLLESDAFWEKDDEIPQEFRDIILVARDNLEARDKAAVKEY